MRRKSTHSHARRAKNKAFAAFQQILRTPQKPKLCYNKRRLAKRVEFLRILSSERGFDL